ncbi:MAG: DNA polymerase I [Marinifilaceae bacterium]|jgi:DNA polymerase-1|nr:DNA polymerase I [Marinifilaceae bacterium]
MHTNPELDKKLFLVDAYALIYRAYFAFIRTPRYTSKGLNTSAILGFTNALMEILEKEKPTHIAVCFDPHGKTFRHDRYPEYKAQRPPMPDDLRNSIPYIEKLLDAMNIKQIKIDYYEADDVVGTIAKRAEKQGFVVYMMTPDKDYAQLVSENIYMYKPKKKDKDVEIMGIQEVLASFGIEDVSQVIDILGLMGDSADNVPGCPGVGPKSANKLVAQYKNIDGIYEHISELKGKQKENLINFEEQVRLSRELVIINTEVPCECPIEETKIKDINRTALKNILEELEFNMLAQRILGDFGEEKQLKDINSIEHSFFKIDTPELINDLLADLCIQEEFAFHSELSNDNANLAVPYSITFALKNNKAFYINLPRQEKELIELLNRFKPIFEDENIGKISHDLKQEMLWMKWYGINLKGSFFDVKIAHYILRPDGKHDLNEIAEEILDYSMLPAPKKKAKKQLMLFGDDSDELSEEELNRKFEEALVFYKLRMELDKQLKDIGTYEVYNNIEMPLIEVLAGMEFTGANVSTSELNSFAKYLKEKLLNIENNIFEIVGEKFNLSSPKQVGEVLFDKLKLDEKAKKTKKTKQYATGEDVLLKIKDKHPMVPMLLEYRKLSKLLNTYALPLPTLINPKSGRIHTYYNQAEAGTGRLSSLNPNLQNIPIRTEEGKKIRSAFIPSDENHILVAADYSQIELRLMAHLSQDEHMLQAFNNNEDIHTATAAKIYHTSLEDVSKEMRTRAKSANFGIIYGVSAWGLAENLEISRKEGKELIDGYFASYPKVKEYMDKSVQIAREQEYVETIMKRRRYLKAINSRNAMQRGIAERNAINAPLQGSAADIIKLAMINVYSRMQKENLSSKMILQVHDELIFDCLKSEKEKLEKILIEEMQDVVKLSIPLTIDVGEGNNWLQAH